MNEQLQELLCDYLEGEISVEKRKQIEELLASDPQLRRTLEEMQHARGALRGLPVEAAPQHAREAIRRQTEQPAPIRMFSGPRFARVAAMLLLALGGGLVIWAVLPSNQARHMAMDTGAVRPATEGQLATEAQLAPAASPAVMKEAADQIPGALPRPSEADNLTLNARAVMVVRARDVSAAEREISSFLATNNIAYVNASVPMPAGSVALGGPAAPLPAAPVVTATPAPVAKDKTNFAGAGGEGAAIPSAPQPGALAKAERKQTVAEPSAKSDAEKNRLYGSDVAAEKPLAAAAGVSSAQPGQQLTMRNMNEEQLRFIRANVYNMADGRKMLVEHESPEIADVAAKQMQTQSQIRRQVPYAQQRDFDALRQDTRMAEQGLQDKATGTLGLYDLTIVVEPAERLPAVTSPATLPVSRPR